MSPRRASAGSPRRRVGRSVPGRSSLATSALLVALAACTSSGDDGVIGIPGAPNPTVPPTSPATTTTPTTAPASTQPPTTADATAVDAEARVTTNDDEATNPEAADPGPTPDETTGDETTGDAAAGGDGGTDSAGGATVPSTTAADASSGSGSADAAPEIVYLRAGDEGPEISILQLKLRTAGFLDPGYTDGVFDRATNAAVLAFQGQYGLIVDGIVGPETQRALTAAALSVNPDG